MRHWAVLFWSAVTCVANNIQFMTKWETEYIPDINSLRYDRLYKEAYVKSSMYCAAIASQKQGLSLLLNNVMCFNKQTRACRMAHTNISQALPATNPGWKCWQSIACLHPSAGRIKVGQEESDIVCPTALSNQCQSTGILNTFVTDGGLVSRPTTCDPPFNMTAVGCLYMDLNTNQTFCASRRACLQLGGDLISPDTFADFIAVTDFLTSLYGPNLTVIDEAQFWVGLTSTDGTYRWISNGRVVAAGEWYPGDPNEGNTTRCASLYQGSKMMDNKCEIAVRAICETKLP